MRTPLELIFARFEPIGTAHGLGVAWCEEGIQIPVRSGRGGHLTGRWPSPAAVLRMLQNPGYAGAYVDGRRQGEEYLDEAQPPRKRTREQPAERWHALITEHHEGYITWEAFERNQRRLRANRRGEPGGGAPREGTALLQGLVLCGRCGRPLKVNYTQRSRLVRSVCTRTPPQGSAALCQSFGALRLERAFAQSVLEALAPLGMDAMLEAAARHRRDSERERALWHPQRERARYEVGLARRQYDAVDPAHRLVARELERRREHALSVLQTLETDIEAKRGALEKPLSAQEHARLRPLAYDLPGLWEAPTTRIQDKKRLIRCLVEQGVVRVPDEQAPLQADVHWVDGEITRIEVLKGRTGIHVSDEELVERVRQRAAEFSDEQIARIFQRKRLKTSQGLPFNAKRVTHLRYTHPIPGHTRATLDNDHVYPVEQAAERLGVDRSTVVRWIELQRLKASQVTPGAPWRVQVTELDRQRLTAGDAPAGGLPLKGAALALGVSQQTVLQKLKRGEIEGVRTQVGARTAWRIRVGSVSSDIQPELFE